MGPADRDVTWSNPQGATLTQLKPQVWWGERPFYPRIPGLRGVDVACKMAVVKLRDGTLWVHAPVALDDKTRAAVDALGPVRHVVTPNTEHLKWAKEWLDAYPDATGYACPGLMDARPDIGYDAEVGRGDPPASWLDEFEVAWIEEERSPFKIFGDKPFFSEVVFNHKQSGVLFVADRAGGTGVAVSACVFNHVSMLKSGGSTVFVLAASPSSSSSSTGGPLGFISFPCPLRSSA